MRTPDGIQTSVIKTEDVLHGAGEEGTMIGKIETIETAYPNGIVEINEVRFWYNYGLNTSTLSHIDSITTSRILKEVL